MKKYSLFIVLVVCGQSIIAEQAADPSMQCFCSYLCEYRDMITEGDNIDTPFIDPETGVCFCKQRDKDKYCAHGCVYKTKPVQETYCSAQAAKKE